MGIRTKLNPMGLNYLKMPKMVFKGKTTNYIIAFSTKYILPCEITVDWGDGEKEVFDCMSQTTFSHKYADTDTYYTITVYSKTGKIPCLYFSFLSYIYEIYTPLLRCIAADGDATDFSNMFYYSTVLSSIPNNLFENNPQITKLNNCFSCANLNSIPEGLFDNTPNVTDFSHCFYNNKSLTSIPQGLFDNTPNVTDFSYCFYDVGVLTSIPQGLFDNTPNVTDFSYCFYDARFLTSIPQGLFDNTPNVTDFSHCFYHSKSLTSIPQGLFDNTPNVTDFSYCFYYGSDITGPVPELWVTHPNAKHDKCFFGCVNASNYDDIPEDWK